MEMFEKIKEVVNDLFKHRYEDEGVYNLSRCKENDKSMNAYRFYVIEILEKMNMASVMHLNRTVEWIKGFYDALECGDWFSAAACLRGAMEAAGDGRYSFKNFVIFLAQEKDFFMDVQDFAKPLKEIHDYEEIEKSVNEFIFAADKKNLKAHSEENLLKDLKCLTSAELKSVLGETVDDQKKERIIEYYASLCEITHPSGYPIRSMYVGDGNGSFIMNKDYMAYGFKTLLNIYMDLYQQIFITPVNVSLLVMRELSLLGVNPQNNIHKYYSLVDCIQENPQIKIVQEAFGLDSFKKLI